MRSMARARYMAGRCLAIGPSSGGADIKYGHLAANLLNLRNLIEALDS